MELVIRGASKLLGDCKAGNICKELKKLKEKDTTSLEATNATLSSQVQELKVGLALKDEEIRELKGHQAENLGRIWEVIGNPGEVVNKAHLFDNDVKTEDKLSAQKIITILVKFEHKIEATLGEMRKLLPGSSATGPSQPSAQVTTSTSPKEVSQKAFEEMKARIQQRKVQEALAKAAKIEVLVSEVRPMKLPTAKPVVVPAATPTAKAMKTKKDLDTKTTSSMPFL